MESAGKYLCCVNPAIPVLRRALLAALPDAYGGPLRAQLGFFSKFFATLPCPDDCREDDWALRSAAMMRKFEEKAEEFEGADDDMTNLDQMCHGLEEMMEQCEPVIKQISILLLNHGPGHSYTCKYAQFQFQSQSQNSLTKSIISKSSSCLRTLRRAHDPMIAPLEKQFAFIEGILEMFEIFVSEAEKAPTDEAVRLGEFMSHTRAWASQIFHLVCFYRSVDVWDDSDTLAVDTGAMLSDLMQNYMSYTPQVIALHLDVLIQFKEKLWKKKTRFRMSYIDFLLEHLMLSGMQTLHEELVFLFSFLLDTETRFYNDSEERQLIDTEIYDIIIIEVPSVVCVSRSPSLSSYFHTSH